MDSASFGLLNCRSVRNKTLPIKDYVVESNLDILALTETWLSTDDTDDHVIGDLIPDGYELHHAPRDGKGGSVGLLFKSVFDLKRSDIRMHFQTFEFLDVLVKSSSTCDLRILVVYRPPSSSSYGNSIELFLDEFGIFLESYVTDPASW